MIAPPNSAKAALASYLHPRPVGAMFLGISSGFPLVLLMATMAYWLSKVGIDKKTIGFAFAIGTPYTLKFLWAPLIDGIAIPGLTRLVGQRRAWIYVVQALLLVAVFNLGASDPVHHIGRFATWGLIVAFLSATQDIVLDAYRIETLPADELAQGTATSMVGYRTGHLLGGAGTIWLASTEGAGLGWASAYALTGLLVIPGAIATLWMGPGNRTALTEKFSLRTIPHFFQHNVAAPLIDFFQRPAAWLILLFILLYRMGDALGQNMLSPMIVAQGFSDTTYINIQKSVGFWVLIGGTLCAGALVVRLGVVRALIGAGSLIMAGNLLFALVALNGRNDGLLMLAVGVELLASAISLTAFTTFLSRQTSTAYTATQFAIMSSTSATGRIFATTPAGHVADALGWPGYYVLCAGVGLPSILLIWVLWKRGLMIGAPSQVEAAT